MAGETTSTLHEEMLEGEYERAVVESTLRGLVRRGLLTTQRGRHATMPDPVDSSSVDPEDDWWDVTADGREVVGGPAPVPELRPAGECFICTKHQDLDLMPGGELLGDEHVVVSHLPLATPGSIEESVYVGYLFVEPRRHVAQLGDLTPTEASAFGRCVALASAALRTATDAEHVYAAVIGHNFEHLHLHLIARHPGTPRQFWWTSVDEWPDAPRGGVAVLAEFADRFRAALPLESVSRSLRRRS